MIIVSSLSKIVGGGWVERVVGGWMESGVVDDDGRRNAFDVQSAVVAS